MRVCVFRSRHTLDLWFVRSDISYFNVMFYWQHVVCRAGPVSAAFSLGAEKWKAKLFFF